MLPSRAPVAVVRSRVTQARLGTAALAAAVTLAGLAALPGQAHAATGGFSPGDLVIYRVGTGAASLTSAATPVFLDELTPSGAPGQTVALPTSSSGANKRLTASGSATSEGELNLSADGRYLVATGYNASVGTASPGSSTASSVPRTVGLIDATGAVDTSTSLTDAISMNNVRGATSADGSSVYVAGADGTSGTPGSGVRYATRGASTSSPLTSSTYSNFRDVVVAGGQLYVSADPTKNGTPVSVASVGTGLPTSGPSTVANLTFSTAPTGPYAFSFLTLGTGSAPDTLYVADNGAGAIVKYALSSGTWVKQGSVALVGVTGVTANDVNGVVSIFATTASGLYSLSDASGQAGTLSGTTAKIASAGANTAYRGVAFTPGTVIGSGPGTPPVVPSVTLAHTGLPAALDDPTNPTDVLTVADDNYPASKLTVTATSSNQNVAVDGGLSVSGNGASRTLTVTPAGAVGTATITVTVSAPDGQSATTSVAYAVSADQGDSSDRYYSGAGNASAAIDVGDGYLVVGDDESDVLRLYDSTRSGPPIATYDFTSRLPYGTAEVDIEGAARVGDTIYWTGSMSNSSKGNLAPARSTVFATTVSGSGAGTTLSYAGAYTGLQTDLVNWDKSNGHGLGADYLGFDASVNGGIANHAADSFNVEGLEFSSSDPNTAYFAFRGPLEPTSNRHLALVVPVTDLPALVAGSTSTATFGAPLFWDLGGLGIRDIRRNADGSYLVLAGTATDANDSFRLYTWDGDPADPPLAGQSLPLVPGGGAQGSWEAIAATPDPLRAGSVVRLLEDNGTTAWYGDANTSKAGLPVDLQKDLGRSFDYVAPDQVSTATTVGASSSRVQVGDQVTYTATVTSTTGSPGGTVAFSGTDGCAARPVGADGTATCAVTYLHAGTYDVSAAYAGTSVYAPSSGQAVTVTVDPESTSTTLDSDDAQLVTGQPVTFTARVTPGSTGTVEFSADGTDLPGCAAVSVDASGQAQCSVPGGFQPSSPTITAAYSGDGDHSASTSAGLAEQVSQAETSSAVTSDPQQPRPGHDLTVTAVVSPVSPGAGTPTGTVTFAVTGPQGVVDCTGGDDVTLSGGTATCVVSGDQVRGGGAYDVEASYGGDTGFAASSGSLDETADRADSTTTVNTSANPAGGGKAVTLRATIASSGSTGATPTGTVTFTVTGVSGATVACKRNNTVAVSGNALATCNVAAGEFSAADAPYTVQADYSGDPQYSPSSGTRQQLVSRAATRTVLRQSPAASAAGKPVTFTATVSAKAGTTPRGDLSITVTDVSGNPVTCDAGPAQPQQISCTVPAGTLVKADGPYTATATYAGDAATAASSATVRHRVTS